MGDKQEATQAQAHAHEDAQRVFIVGIDPGAVTHGFAVIDGVSDVPDDERLFMFLQDESMLKLSAIVTALAPAIKMVIVENFIGHGARDRYAIETLKMVGFAEGICHYLGIPVRLQNPQVRKAFVPTAIEMVQGDHHYTHALAHALAFLHYSRVGKSTYYDGRYIGGQRMREMWGNTTIEQVLQGQPNKDKAIELLQSVRSKKE